MEMNRLKDLLNKYKNNKTYEHKGEIIDTNSQPNLTNKNKNINIKKELIENENFTINQDKKTNKHLLKILYNYRTENNKKNNSLSLMTSRNKEININSIDEKLEKAEDIFNLKENFETYFKNYQMKNLNNEISHTKSPKKKKLFNFNDLDPENINIVQNNVRIENQSLMSTGITQNKIKVLTNNDVIVSDKKNDSLSKLKDQDHLTHLAKIRAKQKNIKLSKIARFRLEQIENNMELFMLLMSNNSNQSGIFSRTIANFLKSCKILNHGVKTHLKKISEIILNNFKQTFKDSFEVVDKKIILNHFRNKSFNADLLIKCRIVIPEKNYRSNITISELSKFYGDDKMCKNIYKFDYEYKNNQNKIWIMRELADFHEDDLNKAYVQPILPFSFNDEFEITVNLISGRGLIDASSLKWLNIKSYPNKKFDYINYNPNKKDKYSQYYTNKDILEFDLSRICELELIKNKWIQFKNNNFLDYLNPFKKNPQYNNVNTENLIDNLVKKIKNYVTPQFEIKKVSFDDMGFLLIKIQMIAKNEGNVKFNEDLGINLIVKDKDKSITNEIKKNGLIFDRSNTLQVVKGDEVVIYISKNK